MSEAELTIADEQAVVGEPASEPHQAVVVGEPQQEQPVLGEPVLLANGVKGQEPIVSSTSVDEPASNGVQLASSISDSQETTEQEPSGTPDVPANPNSSEAIADESSAADALTESEAGAPSTEENPPQAEAVVAQTEEAFATESEGPSVEAEGTPVGRVETTDESVDNKEDPIPSEIPEDIVVSHIDEAPAEAAHPVADVPTENPYQALEEPSITDDSARRDDPSREQEYASLDEAPIVSEAPEADSSLVKSEDSHEQSRDFPLERTVLNEGGNPEPIIDGEPKTGAGTESSTEPVHESQRDVPLEESPVCDATPETENTAAVDDAPVVTEQKVALGEGDGFQHSEKIAQTPEEAPIFQVLTEENGGNVHDHDGGDQAVDRELVLQKDDEKDPKVNEKPSFGIKLPLIISGLAIAAVGVAFASFRRQR